MSILASKVTSFKTGGVRWVILLLLLPLLARKTASSPVVPVETAWTSTISSRTIAMTPDGQLVLAVTPDSNTLSIIEANTLVLLAEIPVGANPQSVVVAPDSTLAYVANKDADSVSVVDLLSLIAVEEIRVGDRPTGAAISPDGLFLAVTELGGDAVRFIHRETRATLSIIPVEDRPYGLSYTPDGRFLLITHLLSGEISVIPVRPYHHLLPLIGAGTSGQGVGEIHNLRPPPDQPAGGRFTVTTWPFIAPAPSVVVNTAGTRAFLPQTMANGQGLNTQFDNTVFPKVSVLNLESWVHQSSEHISLPEVDRPVGLPWDVGLARNDSELWVVNSASNDILVVDISNPNVPAPRAHLAVGHNPKGIVIAPDGSRAYVNNTLSGSISVIDTQQYTVTDEIEISEIPLPPLLLNGKRLFHSSARPELAQAAWISCNTCHIEQEHDGRIWKVQYLGQIPPGGTPVITRNTTSLLGMIETYPLRWSAEWDESADSEFSIRFEQFGTGLIEGDMHPTLGLPNQGRSYDLDSLAAYLDSLVVPERTHTLGPAEERGKIIFESEQSGCLDCHAPPLYSDLQRHDVGTADAFGEWFGPEIDTPTLRFLYDSAPYLHDGSATTLLDVLTENNLADEHGATSHLDSGELHDLVAFLMVLPYQ